MELFTSNLLFLFIPAFSVPCKKLIVLFMTEARDVMRSWSRVACVTDICWRSARPRANIYQIFTRIIATNFFFRFIYVRVLYLREYVRVAYKQIAPLIWPINVYDDIYEYNIFLQYSHAFIEKKIHIRFLVYARAYKHM